MTDTKQSFGSVLKKIRENKGYTQKEIADHTMSRSTYTKFELDSITPNISKYLAILNHLDISHDEFVYIMNDYQLDEKDRIWHLFIENMKNPSVDQAAELIKVSEEYVEDQYDQLILSVLNSVRAFHILLTEKNVEKAKEHAAKVWDRLQELDKWYLRELYLVNSILYLFEIETAVSFTRTALKELNLYTHFNQAKELPILYKFHLSALLIEEELYEHALYYINSLIEDCYASNNFLEWGIALVRKGVCLQKMNAEDNNSQMYIDKAKRLFHALEQEDLVKELEKNPVQFRNVYSKLHTSEAL